MSVKPSHLVRLCFDAGVRAANPASALKSALQTYPDALNVKGKLHVVAAGKASISMMAQMLKMCIPDSALAVTNYENFQELDNCIVLPANHPTPDVKGVKAAHAIISRLQATEQDDTVILLLSGGASALLPAPVPQISFDSKIKVNDLLLGSGLAIGQMNIVRKALSQLKGGGFAALAAPSRVFAFILSDVPDDNLADIASGPTVAAPDAVAEARDVLNGAGIWDDLPADVQSYLSKPRKRKVAPADNTLIAGNTVSVQAMTSAVPDNMKIVMPKSPLTGDVEDAAKAVAQTIAQTEQGIDTVFLWGGETTVKLRGKGVGGRNQELALRVAQCLEGKMQDRQWAFLSGGTDGIDGPTDAAGAVVTQTTLADIKQAGLDLNHTLSQNNSYPVLERINALIKIGATGTNVADLQVAVIRA